MLPVKRAYVRPDLIVHKGDLFSWCDGIGTTKASDLPIPFVGYLFKNNNEQGFIVRSHRTGNEKSFFFVDLMLDEDGNQCFIFSSLDESVVIKVYDE